VIYRRTKIVFGIYSAWTLLLLSVAAVNPGELRVSVHLLLLLTGPPSALLSLSLQHASLLAIASAGAAGTIQWSLFAQFDAWMEQRRDSRRRSPRVQVDEQTEGTGRHGS
jgi:hypothetical protein